MCMYVGVCVYALLSGLIRLLNYCIVVYVCVSVYLCLCVEENMSDAHDVCLFLNRE